MHVCELPGTVQQAVRSLGQTAKADGVKLFVFGSFARGDARPNSDLDLGYELPPGSHPQAEIRLHKAVGQLPTIRPVDLVDLVEFRQVSEAFRDLAVKEVTEL